MKAIVIFTLIAVVVFGLVAFRLNRPQLNRIDAVVPEDFPSEGFSHQLFEDLLKTYVDGAGELDYDAWHESPDDERRLNEYLATVSLYSPENAPERFSTRNDALAYWLYAYNAYVIRSVLDHWPLNSVTDVKAPVEVVKGFGFFYRQRYLFGGKAYSLYAVENAKVRAEFRDARIHFVLNCGSESCPVLRPELPTGGALEDLLQQASVEFVSDERNVHIDHANKRIVLSRIFKWFEKDFIRDLQKRGLPTENGVVSYVASVSNEEQRNELQLASDFDVVFSDYDWSVNKTEAR